MNRQMKRKGEALARRRMGGLANLNKLAEVMKAMPSQEDRVPLQKALEDMSQLSTAVHYLVGDVQGLIYELHKQKMVTFRLMRDMTEEKPSFLVGAGTAPKRGLSIQELLQKEMQYGVEYDVINAIAQLSTPPDEVQYQGSLIEAGG